MTYDTRENENPDICTDCEKEYPDCGYEPLECLENLKQQIGEKRYECIKEMWD